MDKVTIATMNAAILTIYEAALVWIIDRSRRAGDRLADSGRAAANRLGSANSVFRKLDAALSPRKTVRAAIRNDREGNHRLLVRLLRPARISEDARWDADLREADRLLRENRRAEIKLMLAAKEDPDSLRKFLVDESAYAPEMVEDIFEEAERTTASMLRDELRDLDKPSLLNLEAPNEPKLPGDASSQGVLLAALFARWGRSSFFDISQLSTGADVEAWVKSARSAHALEALLSSSDGRAEELIEAAASEYDRRGASSGPTVATDANRAMASLLRSVFPAVRSALSRVHQLELGLETELEAYHRDRPGSVQRILLRAGVIRGALIFIIGVVLPVLWPGCPQFLFAWLPMVWYIGVLAAVCTFAMRTPF